MENVDLLQLDGVKSTNEVIGKGAYGRVIEASMLCAAKEIHQVLVDPETIAVLKQKFLQECLHCSQLCHPNIVQFLGIYYPSEDAKLPWLVMEKLEFSLTHYLKNHKPAKVSFQIRMSILHDISLGLQYLHVQDIIHRDLSSNNVLLTKQLVAKIGDLGVAKVVDPNRMKSATRAPGTIIFMPPEALFVKPKYGKPIDVFSFGCVMIHVITHIWPVPKDETHIDEITAKRVARSEIERRQDYLENIQEPVKLKELILRCLQDLPQQRPSVSDVSRIFRQIQPDLKLTTVQSIVFDHDLMQGQVETLQAKVKMLTDELTVERNATVTVNDQLDVALGRLQQLQNEKRMLELHMMTGNKEREDRITELEEHINDQATEHDEVKLALKETVVNKEEDYKKLYEYYKAAKTLVETYENRYITQEDTISQLEQKLELQFEEQRQCDDSASEKIRLLEAEKEDLLKSNFNLSQKVARLMNVDKECTPCADNKSTNQYGHLLQKAEEKIKEYEVELRKAVEELQTKEFLINTYKEDFEQERKDRENAHRIKEDVIKEVRVEMEQLKVEYEDKIRQQVPEGQAATYKKQASHFSALCTKLTKERDKLYNDLERERREAHTKLDVYKKKTEQFQVQWRKREEAEAHLTAVTEELSTQRNLNKQQQVTIDDLMRTKKNIQPQIPTNVSSHQSYDFQHDQRRVSPNNAQFTDTPTLTSAGNTNAELAFQQHPSQPQQAWGQGSQQPQSYQYHQQHDQLHQRGQMHQSSGSRGNPSQGGEYLPPSPTIDSQPSFMQPHHSRYNIAGTNASMQQDKFVADEAHHRHFGERHTGPVSLGSYQARQAAGYGNTNLPPLVPPVRSERPPPVQAKQFASEGINEEIRKQADKQRHQNQQELEFTFHLEYDPYLICPRCKLQFKEGQLPEYRHHIDNCRH